VNDLFKIMGLKHCSEGVYKRCNMFISNAGMSPMIDMIPARNIFIEEDSEAWRATDFGAL